MFMDYLIALSDRLSLGLPSFPYLFNPLPCMPLTVPYDCFIMSCDFLYVYDSTIFYHYCSISGIPMV
jgi:hypothetical protein